LDSPRRLQNSQHNAEMCVLPTLASDAALPSFAKVGSLRSPAAYALRHHYNGHLLVEAVDVDS